MSKTIYQKKRKIVIFKLLSVKFERVLYQKLTKRNRFERFRYDQFLLILAGNIRRFYSLKYLKPRFIFNRGFISWKFFSITLNGCFLTMLPFLDRTFLYNRVKNIPLRGCRYFFKKMNKNYWFQSFHKKSVFFLENANCFEFAFSIVLSFFRKNLLKKVRFVKFNLYYYMFYRLFKVKLNFSSSLFLRKCISCKWFDKVLNLRKISGSFFFFLSFFNFFNSYFFICFFSFILCQFLLSTFFSTFFIFLNLFSGFFLTQFLYLNIISG